jgi:hypothetical protein
LTRHAAAQIFPVPAVLSVDNTPTYPVPHNEAFTQLLEEVKNKPVAHVLHPVLLLPTVHVEHNDEQA